MTKFKSDNQNENIETAKRIMEDAGIFDYNFIGYSDSNGVSVYFRNSNDVKVRISDHGVENTDRMKTEILLSFDAKMLGMGGKVSEKSYEKINKFMGKRFGY